MSKIVLLFVSLFVLASLVFASCTPAATVTVTAPAITMTPPTVTITAPYPTTLATPKQVSPEDGSRLTNFPRTLTFVWERVPCASSYIVEVDCRDACQNNKWCSEVSQTFHKKEGLTSNSYTYTFVGDNPGRWRVWAVDQYGNASEKSDWWYFQFHTG
jgi:hypothetical protein